MGGILRGLFRAAEKVDPAVEAAAQAAKQIVPNAAPGQVAAQIPSPAPTVTGPTPQPTPAGAANAPVTTPAGGSGPAAASASPTPQPVAGKGTPARPLPPSLIQMQERAGAKARTTTSLARAESGAMPAGNASKFAGAPVDPTLDLARQTSPGPGPRNYNLYQFQTTDEAIQTIQTIAATRVAAKGMEAPHTWADVRQEANAYTYEGLMGKPLPKGGIQTGGRNWNDTEITAAAQLLGGHVERLVELNKLYTTAPDMMTAADKLEFRLTATRATALEEMLSNEAREAARTLNVLKMAKAPRGTASAIRATDATLIEMGGDDSLAALSQLLSTYATNPAALIRAVKANERFIGWGDMAREYAINNMFSLVTHARNVGGNLIRATGDMFVEGPVRALVDKAARPASRTSPAQYDQRYVREVVVKGKAIADGFGEAVKLSWGSLLERPNVLQGTTKLETGVGGGGMNRPAITGSNVEALLAKKNGAPVLSMATQGIIDWFGIAARRHTNLLGTMDTFFRSLNTRSELYSSLYRSGRQNGLNHSDATDAMYKGLELPDADTYQAAAKSAEEMISATPLPMMGKGGAGDPVRYLGGLVNQGLMHSPWAKFITAPFLKTPVNLASWVYRRTPVVGLAQMDTKIAGKAAWQAMLGDASMIEQGAGAAFSRVMTQQAIGWAAYIYVTDRVTKGEMTGAVTGLERGDSVQASQMGLPKNSYIMKDAAGNKYGQSTGGLDPAFTLLNTIATYHEMALYAETEEDAEMAYMSAAWVMGKVMLDRQFLTGFHDLFNLVEDPNAKSAAKFLGGQVSRFIPMQGDLNRLMQRPDPNLPQREGEGETAIGNAYPTYQPAGLDALKVADLVDFLGVIAHEIQNRSPFYNKDRPYRVNGWGEPMLTWGNYIERNISPSFYQPMNPKDVQERDKLLWANGLDHPELTFTMSFKGIAVDVRDIEVTGKPLGWAWQDYQEVVGKARAAAVDALKDLPVDRDSVSDTPGSNRVPLQKAIALGTRVGQLQWMSKQYVRDAFALRGIEVTDEMLTPAPARPVPKPLLNEIKKPTETAGVGPTFGAQ